VRDEIVIKRYADAFILYVKQGTGLEKAFLDLKNLRNVVIHDNPQFLELLKSPEITYAEKCEFIDSVLKDDFSEELRHFLKLLLKKERIDKFLDIAEYIRVTYSYGEETEALLKTAYPLDLELIKTIQGRLEAKFKRRLKFYIELDGTLLGGVQVVIGNTVIDGSVRRRLDELKEKLMAVRV
jgi:F-type H+-transporting ATPase subunit delta